MFGSLWLAIIGGGPAEWAGLALGAFLLLSASFAGGAFYEANHIASQGTAIAVKAQHDHDVKQHAVAVVAGKQVEVRHATGDAKAKIIIHTIHDLKTVTVGTPADPHACDLTPEALQLLNDAGKQ